MAHYPLENPPEYDALVRIADDRLPVIVPDAEGGCYLGVYRAAKSSAVYSDDAWERVECIAAVMIHTRQAVDE